VLSKRPTGHADTVYSVAVRRDGRLAATSSYDDTIRLWDITDPAGPRMLDKLTGHDDDVNLWFSAPTERPWPRAPTITTSASGT
jgi:WD40 repeat protein